MSRHALRSPMLVAGLLIVGAFVVIALLAPVLAPHGLNEELGDPRLHPSGTHLLGTDTAGHDILSQLIWGARYSLTVAVAAATLATVVGVTIGLLSGLVGGLVDTVVSRMVDVFLALPGLPLAILIGTLLAPTQGLVILLIASAGWAPIARTVRSEALTLRQRGFVQMARGNGAGPLYVVRRHLVPPLGPIIAARWVDYLSVAIFVESGLAFLGLSDPLHVSWGTLLDSAFDLGPLGIGDVWLWWVLPAGAAITLAVVGFTLVGVGLEPVFNRRVERS